MLLVRGMLWKSLLELQKDHYADPKNRQSSVVLVAKGEFEICD